MILPFGFVAVALAAEVAKKWMDMGFRPEPTIYNLTFKDSPLDGLHVRASCCTVSEYNEMLAAAATTGEINEEVLRHNDRMLQLFANHLVSWDLEDLTGRPVPTTREGIDSQERTLIAQVVTAWQISMVSVPNPSEPGSSDGKISEEQSLGLGNASGSPGN